MKLFCITLLLSSMLVVNKSFCQEDHCSDILKVAFNYEQESESKDVTTSVFNYLLSDNLKVYIHNEGSGFSIGYKEASLGYHSTTGDYSKFRDYLNSHNSYAEKETIVKHILKQTANPNAYKFWFACINRNQYGIYFNSNKAGETYTVAIRYNQFPKIPTLRIQSLYITNAIYNVSAVGKLRGVILQNVPTEITLTPMDKYTDITISLTASGGSASKTFLRVYTIPGMALPEKTYPNIAGTWTHDNEIYLIKKDETNSKEFYLDIIDSTNGLHHTGHGFFISDDSAVVNLRRVVSSCTRDLILYWKLSEDRSQIKNVITLAEPGDFCGLKWDDYKMKPNGEFPGQNKLRKQ